MNRLLLQFKDICAERRLALRDVSMAAGLNHQTVRIWFELGRVPNMRDFEKALAVVGMKLSMVKHGDPDQRLIGSLKLEQQMPLKVIDDIHPFLVKILEISWEHRIYLKEACRLCGVSYNGALRTWWAAGSRGGFRLQNFEPLLAVLGYHLEISQAD